MIEDLRKHYMWDLDLRKHYMWDMTFRNKELTCCWYNK